MSKKIYLYLFIFWSPLANSCEEYFDIGDNQVQETQKKIADANNLDFEAIIAFEQLMCADRAYVRSFATEIGLLSENTTIRSRALLSTLLEKETITLEPYFKENLTSSEKEFVKNNSVLPFSVRFRNTDKSCMSLYSPTECKPDYVVSVEGDEVTLRYDDKTARLSLNNEGELEGIYTGKKLEATRIPVRIILK